MRIDETKKNCYSSLLILFWTAALSSKERLLHFIYKSLVHEFDAFPFM